MEKEKRRRLPEPLRRQQIQEAAQRVFLEKGFVSTTMEDIVAATGMSKGGVYHYYRNTTDLLHDIMSAGNQYRREKMQAYLEALRQEGRSLSVEDRIEMILEKILDQNSYTRLYVHFLEAIPGEPHLRRLFEELKEESIREMMELLGWTSETWGRKIGGFLSDFINSLILGGEILGAREGFRHERELLAHMLAVYFREQEDSLL